MSKKSTIYRTFLKKSTINVSNLKTIRNYNRSVYVVGGSIMRFKRDDENYVYSFVGKNIKKYRKMKGLTQDALAELVNYSPSFIANIESSTHQTFSLGASIQVKYKCEKCKKITERKEHCGKETNYYKGIKWIDNNLVNLLSNAIVFIILLIILNYN